MSPAAAGRTTRAARPPQGPRRPSLRVERALQRDGHRVLAGMDEVGRGALAGPVTVGVVVIDETCRSAPQGVRDSKLLQPQVREAMVPRIRRWALCHAVAHASAAEIDEIGIIAGLRLAGTRALAACGVRPDLVILDGNHDWLTSPEDVGLLAFAHEDEVVTPPVTTMVKADLRCSSVAAASVLAKVTRDRIMVDLGAEDGEHARYGWVGNKGYAAPDHLEALRVHGPSVWHRRSWRLPGAMDDDGGVLSPVPTPSGEPADRAGVAGPVGPAPAHPGDEVADPFPPDRLMRAGER
ncbi:ribonuclease HII [Phycicoccus flavus]|uniref:ribonuclease HII n=1 Tax=Phycicoccus flavus TaxID=2502783 RepID=UPI0026974A53|nr:ribonuclease HII [Phycicoccus flavus]